MMTVTIVHISNLAPVSDYDVSVRVNHRSIATGIVKGHRRDDGWRRLLERIARELPDRKTSA